MRFFQSLKTTWPWLAAASSGGLLAFCLAPWNFGSLCWIALIPLICAIWFAPQAKRPALRHAQLGYVCGLFFFTTTFYWLSALGTLFEQFWLKGLPLLLALVLALYPAFWAWFLGRLNKNFHSSGSNLLTALLGASAWVTHEWVRGWLFSGFGWNSLGVSLNKDLVMIQIVDITGVAGLSFLVAFCNLMAVLIVRRVTGELGPTFLKRVRWEFSFTMAMVAAVFIYGVFRLWQVPAPDGGTLRIAAIQPNIPQTEKFSREAEERTMRKIAQWTSLAAMQEPDLILWPESAIPGGLFASEFSHDLVTDLMSGAKFSLLLGTVDANLEAGEDYNTATLLTDKGSQSYRKMHLVPFGEYLPFRKSFPLFAMVAGELVPGDFTPGRDFTVFTLPTLKFSALVCFEDTLGDLTRHFVLNGAQILVNITNDGWFLETAGAEQHLANAIFRAVENRRPLVRCANTGITGLIESNGKVSRWLNPFEEGYSVTKISFPSQDAPKTFYTRFGDWFVHGCVLLCCLQLLLSLRRKI